MFCHFNCRLYTYLICYSVRENLARGKNLMRNECTHQFIVYRCCLSARRDGSFVSKWALQKSQFKIFILMDICLSIFICYLITAMATGKCTTPWWTIGILEQSENFHIKLVHYRWKFQSHHAKNLTKQLDYFDSRSEMFFSTKLIWLFIAFF